MKKIIKEDKDKGIIQITVCDERWYSKQNEEETKYVPSVTWITSYYPKGIAYHKWLAQKGWDEAEALKIAAGDKGSKVHSAIVDLLDGNEVTMEAQYFNNSTEEMEELTLEEYEALMSFVAWWRSLVKPRILARELIVFDDDFNYAGTVDLICEINGIPWVIDFKTSQYIWPSHELQVSAYKNVIDKDNVTEHKIGILQLGFRKNKRKYKFTEIKDKFDLFLAAKTIWSEECSKIEPLKKDYPTSLTLREDKNA